MINPQLNEWFGLSRASFLTLPRVFMQEMPEQWQERMAELLNEYDETFTNQPDIQTIVQCKQDNKFIQTPSWLINYRRPDKQLINSFKRN